MGAVRNTGASLATGNYLLFHDGDDLFLAWTLDVFERVIQAKNPETDPRRFLVVRWNAVSAAARRQILLTKYASSNTKITCEETGPSARLFAM